MIKHLDQLGQELNVGDYVTSVYHEESLGLFIIERQTPKMIRIKRVNSRFNPLRYPQYVCKVDQDAALMYILKGKR